MKGADPPSSTSGQLCTKLRFGNSVAAEGMNPLRPMSAGRPSSGHTARAEAMTSGW